MGSPTPDDDPRPGQAGWPPPPGPGGPYPQQGGYPGGPYGGPPPGGGDNRRGLLIALVVGLVVLAAIAVALVVAFTRDGGETVPADPSGTAGEAPSTPSSSPSTSEPAPSPGPSGTGDRTEELLAAVPVDFPDCRPAEIPVDAAVAAVACGPSTTQPGPQSAEFYLYEDAGTLDQVFAQEAADVDPMPPGEDCSTAQGVTTWDVGGVEGGEVGCLITEDGPVLAWSDREFGIEGIVTGSGSTQAELAELAQWWTTNSAFRG